jgi:PKD repeat protein
VLAASAANDAAIEFTGANLADAVAGTADEDPPDADGAALFWNPGALQFLLRRTASDAIDKGASEGTGTDIYGEPRKAGAATDLGADEYVNARPVVAVKGSKAEPAPGEKVTYTANATDPDAAGGGGIVEYFWVFSDGRQAVTTGPSLDHTWSTEGDKTVKVAVKDNVGAISEVATLKVLVSPVKDTAPPEVTILQPKGGQKLDLRGTKPKTPGKKRTPAQLTVLGGVTDATGIKQVDVSVRLVKRKKGKNPGAGRCTYLKGLKGLRTTDCDEPVWVKAARNRNVWRLRTTKGWRVPKGTYEVRARGTDIVGNVSGGDAPVVRFTVKR